MKNHVFMYFIPCVIFSSNFWHAVTFLHVLHLDVLRRQTEIETEGKNCNFLMYAGPPMAIPIYSVLPHCVISHLRARVSRECLRASKNRSAFGPVADQTAAFPVLVR